MSYRINGPTEIGDTATLNTVNGDVTLADITTTHGDIVYADGSNNLARVAPGTVGEVLQTNGSGASPSWVMASASLGNGFSARKTGTQGSIVGTPVVITTWSVGMGIEYDTTGGDFVPATGIFTAGAAGTYKIDVDVAFTQTANNGSRVLDLFLNGTTVIFQKTFQPSGGNNTTQNASISSQLSLAMNDTLSVRLYRSSGNSTLTVQASPETWWAMTKLS